MLQSKSGTFTCTQLSVPDAAIKLWRSLQRNDGRLPDLDQVGTGEVVGGHLRVKFVRDSEGQVFACEVADVLNGRIWEAGFARIAKTMWCTFWRDVSPSPNEPEEWRAASAGLILAPHAPRYEPTFEAVAAAQAAAGGLVLGENLATRAAADDELEYWRDLARSQASVIGQLRTAPTWPSRETEGQDVAQRPAAERAWTLKDLGAWAAVNSERIVVLPRAIAAARKAPYEDAATVFAALEVLAGTYREVKAGNAPRDKARTELEALGVSMGGSVDPAYAGDEYFVRWSGRRRFLDQHLKKGTSRDPRFALRIYYTWDDELSVCVVGSLPFHLSNSLS
jgi:hypothetical protein